MHHTHRLRFPFLLLAALTLLHLPMPSRVHGDIYQWEWVDPSDHSKGKHQSTTLCPDGEWANIDNPYFFNIDNLDLSKAYLVGINTEWYYSICNTILTDADLTQAILQGTIFRGGSLKNADLTQANLNYGGFSQVDLTGANFTDAKVRGTNFSGETSYGFTEAQLQSTYDYKSHCLSCIQLQANEMSGWDFHGLTMSVSFGSSKLSGSNFAQTILFGSDFSNATLIVANFTGSDVRFTSFSCTTSNGFTQQQLQATNSYQTRDLSGIILEGNDLSAWDFTKQNLTQASLANSTISNADFSSANLMNAKFNSAKLNGTIFTNAWIRGTSFSQTVAKGFSQAQLHATANYQAHELICVKLDSNDLSGWDFSNLVLTDASFSSSKLTGTNFANSQINGANFSGTVALGLTQQQLQATASFHANDLSSVNLNHNDLSGWDFHGLNLTSASFVSTQLAGTVFTDSQVRFADFSESTITQTQLQSTASFQSGDLTGMRFGTNNLSGWDLSKKNLAGSAFTATDLTATNLSRANLTNAQFIGANLNNTDFSQTNLSGSSFLPYISSQNDSLQGVNFTGANLSNVLFEANLSGANFTNAIIQGANFCCGGFTESQLRSTASYQAHNLTGVQFGFNDLSGWDFQNQNLRNASFGIADLTGTNFTDAQIQGANFSSSGITLVQLQSTASYKAGDLTHINFSYRKLDGWDFHNQNLSEANLGGASLKNTNFTQAILSNTLFWWNADCSGADFSQATVLNSYFQEATLSNVKFTQANLSNSYFSAAVLTGANFHQANLTGVYFALADVSNADFSDAILNGACFYGAKGFTESQLKSSASYKIHDLSGIYLYGNNLRDWDFRNQNLTNADFFFATLTGTMFAGATIKNACFSDTTSRGFTQLQLQSTASYQMQDLSGIMLANNDLSGWDFHNQNITNADFDSSRLSGTNFANANIKGADFGNTTSMGFTQAQLQSTVSYKEKNLESCRLYSDDLRGWDFRDVDLRSANFYDSLLAGTDFTNAKIQKASFRNTTSAGFTQAQLQATQSFKNHDLNSIDLSENDLTCWDLTNQNLQNASFNSSILSGTIFTNATIKGVRFGYATKNGFTQAQLQSTASYKMGDLSGIILSDCDLSAWDFHNQELKDAAMEDAILTAANFENAHGIGAAIDYADLTNANFRSANFANADFGSATFANTCLRNAFLINVRFSWATINRTDFSFADTRGATDLSFGDSVMNNTILPDGSIQGLDLSNSQTLLIRNFAPNPSEYPYSTASIPITIQNSMKLGGTGTLQMVFDGKPWNSTISFAAEIPVDCNGTLDLTIDPNANVLVQLGKKCKIFDWSGVNPTGAFRVTSLYNWDTSQLYSTGEVTLAYSPNLADTKWTGKASSSWNNAANWTAGVPADGAVVEFNALAPTRQPFLQNIADPMRLKGILFAPGAGTHYLGGPTIQFGTGSEDDPTPVIVCMSKNDQFIGNRLDLESETIINVTDSGVLNLAGEINGNGKLTKTGLGTLLLANESYLSSGVRIEEGILALDETGQIHSGWITNEAAFQILTGDHTVSSINGGGTTVVLSGTLTAESIVQDSLTIGSLGSQASQTVPEPGMLALIAAGMAGLLGWKWGRRKELG